MGQSLKVTRWATLIQPGQQTLCFLQPSRGPTSSTLAAEDTSAWRDGIAKHCGTWECQGFNKLQCVGGGGWGDGSSLLPGAGSHLHVPLPQPFLLLLSSPLKATPLCFIDLCLVQRTGGPISLCSLEGEIAACLEHLLALTRHQRQIISSRKSACQS